MFKWIARLFKEFQQTQIDLQEAGIFTFWTAHGSYTYFDPELHELYLKRKERK